MNCIRVRTCCFMCSVTTGSKIFGWVITLASTIGIIYLAATFNDSTFPPPISIAGLTFGSIILFGGVTLLVGIYSESSNAVLGALIILVLVFLGAVAMAVPFLEGYITGTVSFMKTLPSFAGIMLLILGSGLSVIITNSYRLDKVEELLALYAPDSMALSDEEIIIVNRPNYAFPPGPGPARQLVQGGAMKQPDGFRYGKHPRDAIDPRKFSRHGHRYSPNQRRYYPTQSYAVYRPIYRRAVLTGLAKPTEGIFGTYELKYKPPEGTYY